MRCAIVFVLAASLLPGGQLVAAPWNTAPSYFTHDPATGERVRQYEPNRPVYAPTRADFVQSGYRHTRSSLRGHFSYDHRHTVEQWGRPLRPYGEWEYPFRPYSVPYDLWGPPVLGILPLPVPYASPGLRMQGGGRRIEDGERWMERAREHRPDEN